MPKRNRFQKIWKGTNNINAISARNIPEHILSVKE